jgi:hypothetical protein
VSSLRLRSDDTEQICLTGCELKCAWEYKASRLTVFLVTPFHVQMHIAGIRIVCSSKCGHFSEKRSRILCVGVKCQSINAEQENLSVCQFADASFIVRTVDETH